MTPMFHFLFHFQPGPVRATNKSPPRERPASRRDAASLTEPADHGESSGTWGPGRRRQRRRHLNRPKEPHSSDEEPMRFVTHVAFLLESPVHLLKC